jgi:regulator of nucleoside diphosphate kinase
MYATVHGERTLTELDFSRLTKLLGSHPLPRLADLLDVADVLRPPEIPQDIVTMNSEVELEDLRTQHRQKLTVCYPADAEPGAGFVSVLSPVGSGVLGLHTGAVAQWQMPGGGMGEARIIAIHFQPEASGDGRT